MQKNFYQCGCEVISSSSATGSILFGISRFVKRKLNFNLIFSVVVRPPTAPKSSVGKMTTFYLQRILMPIFSDFGERKLLYLIIAPWSEAGRKRYSSSPSLYTLWLVWTNKSWSRQKWPPHQFEVCPPAQDSQQIEKEEDYFNGHFHLLEKLLCELNVIRQWWTADVAVYLFGFYAIITIV